MTPAVVLGLVAGTTFALTGVALIALRPARRGIFWFAIYAILISAVQILVYLTVIFPERSIFASMGGPLTGMSGASLIAAISAYRGDRRRWPVLVVLGSVAAGAVVAFVEPERMLLPEGGLNSLGIVLWQMPVFIAASYASWGLLLSGRSTTSPELRKEAHLLILAVLPHLGYTSSVALLVAANTPDIQWALWGWGYFVTFGIGLVTAISISALLVRAGGALATGLSILVLAATVAGAIQYRLVPEFIVFGGAFRILAAIMLAYGLLKYGLFGTDLKLKWSLDRGALLAIFGGVFFVVEQAAEIFVSAVFGTMAGLVAAGLLLLAFKPIRKATAKLADRVFPHVHPTAEYFAARKLVIYRSAAEAAAKDGIVTDRERAMLDALVRELEIEPAVVATVEREILRGAATG